MVDGSERVFTALNIGDAVTEYGSKAIDNIHDGLRGGDVDLGNNNFVFARSTAYLVAVDMNYTYTTPRDTTDIDDEGFLNRRSTSSVLHAYFDTFHGVTEGAVPDANGVYTFDDDYDVDRFQECINNISGPDTIKFEMSIQAGGYNQIDDASFVSNYYTNRIAQDPESFPMRGLSRYGTALWTRVYAANNRYEGPVSYTHLTLPTICSV